MTDVHVYSVQIPTFFLFADVQGILHEDHARAIAERMFERQRIWSRFTLARLKRGAHHEPQTLSIDRGNDRARAYRLKLTARTHSDH